MYDKANVCRTANGLIKEGYTRSDAFKTAWQLEKNNVRVRSSKKDGESTLNIQLLAKVKEYKELQKMIEELENKVSEIKTNITAEMEAQQAQEISVDIFKIKYIDVVSKRFNTTEFKQTHTDLYEQYLKESTCKRFTITA